jgi:hypothetical protein
VSNQFKPLADGEVVIVNNKNTYRVSDLATEIRSKIADHLAEFTEWSNAQGVEGEALCFGSKGWEKGKVRLHLSIEFCPNDDVAQANVNVGSTSNTAASGYTPTAPFFAGSGDSSNQMSAVASPAVPDTTVLATAATGIAATTVLQNSPPINSNSIDVEIDPGTETETFEMGTMSEATGEINMHLNDRDSSGYVDFDRSDSLPEVNFDLDNLVTKADGPRPSIIDEVWTEMSQPNWPGVSHA